MNSVVGHSSLVVGKTISCDESIAISKRTRWVAGVTGCVTAAVGVPILSLLSPVLAGCLVLGALLASCFPRYARDLMWFGAGVTSLWMFPWGFGILRLAIKLGGTDWRVIAAIIGAMVLTVCSDAALVIEAVGQRRTTNDERRT